MSKHALRLLHGFPGFTVRSESLDALFRKARDSLLIEDLHFHDARAAALTRFSRKVDVLELARISGHKDLRTLMQVYYRASSEDIAGRLKPKLRGFYGYFKHVSVGALNDVDQWLRGRLRSILRKRAGRRGRGRGLDHHRWSNRYFADAGLFVLEDARWKEIISLRNAVEC